MFRTLQNHKEETLTLPAEMFGVTDFWLETRLIIKIFKKMIAGMKIKVVFIGKHTKKNFFFEKKNSKWPT